MKSFAIQTPQYEGPLDLLLSIIRRNELSIADLPLAPIAAQYLAYIQEAEALDVTLGMEWIEMAARLIHWKSSSLLPADPTLPDPGVALAEELSLELKTLSEAQLVQAKRFLVDRIEELERIWSHSSAASVPEHPQVEDEPFASLWTVRRKAQTLRVLFLQYRERPNLAYDVAEESVTMDEMLDWVRHRITTLEPGARVSGDVWFAEMATIDRKISLFLALLEVARSCAVRLDEGQVEQTFWISKLAKRYRHQTNR